MAITLVQHAQNSGASVSSLTITVSSTGAGNCLVVCVAMSAAATVSSVKLGSSADNFASLVSNASGANYDSAIWADPNCAGGGTSVVVTPSTACNICVDVYEFSGIATSSPLDKSSNNGSTTSSSFTSGATATTTQAVEAWVGVVCIGASADTPTGPGSPWTNESEQTAGSKAGSIAELSGYQITTSTGAATYSGTISGSPAYSACVVTLLPALPPIPPKPVNVRQAVMRAATR